MKIHKCFSRLSINNWQICGWKYCRKWISLTFLQLNANSFDLAVIMMININLKLISHETVTFLSFQFESSSKHRAKWHFDKLNYELCEMNFSFETKITISIQKSISKGNIYLTLRFLLSSPTAEIILCHLLWFLSNWNPNVESKSIIIDSEFPKLVSTSSMSKLLTFYIRNC